MLAVFLTALILAGPAMGAAGSAPKPVSASSPAWSPAWPREGVRNQTWERGCGPGFMNPHQREKNR